ncbi:terminase small subunit [Rhodococcus pyridinivorans]|uniref:terminase small subunit n=1 Tax=Rhodococcus pyridinivorans TaxID=103816 RepID=UPI00280B26AC|nr:terminase small subunit [Rhodococcus pyridinivorans]WMM74456.1 terminase small subunit [Rhodococcus pyridinivorans]
MADNDSNEHDNKGGRPLKFQSVAELQRKIDEYFGECDSHVATRQYFKKKADGTQYLAEEEYLTDQQPYTVNGLAYALDTSRDVLIDYESGKYDEKAEDFDGTGARFSNTIKRAKAKIAADVERRTMNGSTPAAAGIFWLKNNNGWKDRQEVDHTTKDQPIPLLAGLAPAELVVEDDDGSTAQADDSADEDQQS